MALFSMETSPAKSWLVANMKIWGCIPVFLVWLMVGFIYKSTAATPIDLADSILGLALFPAIIMSILFTSIQESNKPLWGYALIVFLPIIFLISYIMGEARPEFMTTGMLVWLSIDVVISLAFGVLIGYFTFQNYDDLFSRLFMFRSSAVDIYSSRMAFSFIRFAEAYLFMCLMLSSFCLFFA